MSSNPTSDLLRARRVLSKTQRVQHLVNHRGGEVIGAFPARALDGDWTRSDDAAAGAGIQERPSIPAWGMAPVVKLNPAQVVANPLALSWCGESR